MIFPETLHGIVMIFSAHFDGTIRAFHTTRDATMRMRAQKFFLSQ
jgi:hypothetical protein